MRLFVALAPPENQRREIALCVEQNDGGAQGRVMPPQNLHLTLAFLGEVGAERRGELERAIETLSTHAAFEAEWGGMQAFPDPGRARVAVLGTKSGARELAALAADLLSALPEDLRPRESRRFRPHLTVVRYRQPPPRKAVEELGRRLAPFSWRCRIDRVELVESHLEPAGARYRSLYGVELRGT